MFFFIILGNKIVAQLLTFAVSAVAHEWIIVATLGHFFPILALYFFVGALISLYIRPPNNKITNLIFLYLYQLGVGQVVGFHIMEYFSRMRGVHQFPLSFDVFPVRSEHPDYRQ